MENSYSFTTKANIDTVSFDGRMSVADVMSLFQYIVSEHTDSLGIGFQSIMDNHNAKWIIVRIRFEFSRFPSIGERVTAKTWPLKPGPVKFTRSFTLNDENGAPLARAFSDWCIIDADTSELLRTSVLGSPLDSYLTDRVITGRFSNTVLQSGEKVYEKTMRISDLDINRHVNNITYIKLAFDCFSTEELEQIKIDSFEIYYLSQCFEGDTVTLYRTDTDDGAYYIEARRGETPIFRSVINK